MPKRLLSLLAILFCVSMSRAVVAAPKLFHDEANGYQVQYDSSIQFTENHVGNEVWYMEWTGPDGQKYFNLHLTISQTTKTDTSDVCQDMCWKISKTATAISKVVRVGILPGLYGFSFKMVTPPDAQSAARFPCGIETESCQYVVLDGKRAFMFTATTYPDQFNSIRPRWERVISTLRFDH